jgi:hypothetical protein
VVSHASEFPTRYYTNTACHLIPNAGNERSVVARKCHTAGISKVMLRAVAPPSTIIHPPHLMITCTAHGRASEQRATSRLCACIVSGKWKWWKRAQTSSQARGVCIAQGSQAALHEAHIGHVPHDKPNARQPRSVTTGPTKTCAPSAPHAAATVDFGLLQDIHRFQESSVLPAQPPWCRKATA